MRYRTRTRVIDVQNREVFNYKQPVVSMETLPTLLKSAREAVGLTQDELGQKLGVSQQTIAHWETGKHHPRGPQVQALEKELQTTLQRKTMLPYTHPALATLLGDLPPAGTPIEEDHRQALLAALAATIAYLHLPVKPSKE